MSQMTEQESRQRRDLIALALDISVFYLAGGSLAKETQIFWAVKIDHPVALKIIAALIFSWFLYRYELYVGREGRARFRKYLQQQLGSSPAVARFRERLIEHIGRWFDDTRWEDITEVVDLTDDEQTNLRQEYIRQWGRHPESRVDIAAWWWVVVTPEARKIGFRSGIHGDEAVQIAPRLRVGFWYEFQATAFMVKQVLFRDSHFSDYAVPYLLAFFAAGLTMWFEFGRL